jgi:hypothetical protein
MTTELESLFKQVSLAERRAQTVAAIERATKTTKAKISRLEQPGDVKPFVDCVNRVKGLKEKSEARLILP